MTYRRPTSGSVIAINEIQAEWKSRKQVGVALSSCESAYIVISECTKQVNEVCMLLQELGLLEEGLTVVFDDNTGVIKRTKSEKWPSTSMFSAILSKMNFRMGL